MSVYLEDLKEVQILKRGEIYYVNLGEDNIGSEVNKTRPCLVIQNNVGNKFSPTTIVLPISHKKSNKVYPTQIELKEWMFGEEFNTINGVVMGEQIRVVDKRRVKKLAGVLSPEAIELINKVVLISIGINFTQGINESA